jgi:hypothetical protein
MRTFLRNNAIALVALVVAIGGTSYAAAKLTGRDVKPDALTGKQVKESTLKAVRIVGRATGTDDVIAMPADPSNPPEDPDDFGSAYPVKPAKFRLDGAGMIRPTGRIQMDLASPCLVGIGNAFIFVDDKLVGVGSGPVPLPPGLESLPLNVASGPERLPKGEHRIEVRVGSSCLIPSPGPGEDPIPAAEVERIDLSMLVYP